MRENPQVDRESAWKLYRSSEEYLQLRVLLRSLSQLPQDAALESSRADYEFCLHALGRLGDLLEVEKIAKSYRAYYSPEVQLSGYLYSTLLTAYTLLPSYLLNGQEYYVSDTVLDQCSSLQNVFSQTCREVQRHYENLAPHTLMEVRADVKRSLVYFDRTWCRFEIPALEEIEAIHRQACRPLIDAIQVDQQLADFERVRPKGQPVAGSHRIREQVQRSRLIEKICELNSLANVDGKGRSDLDLACIVEAEKINSLRVCCYYHCHVLKGNASCDHTCMNCASPVIVRVAKALLSRLSALRRLLRRYARCLYQVNSHLANNPDLVAALERFEAAWEQSQKYLLTPKYKQLALHAFDLITRVQDQAFQIALQDLEPEILIKISHALLLYEMLAATTGPAPSADPREKGDRPQQASDFPRPFSLDGAQPHMKVGVAAEFLPPDHRQLFAETATAVSQLSEDQLLVVHRLLIHPDNSSRPPTAIIPKLLEGDAKEPGARADFPCPPRMVPPASPDLPTPEPDGADSDIDDDVVEELNLQPLIAQAVQEAVQAVPRTEAEQAAPDAAPTAVQVADLRADPAVRAVVANISRLGMHIQRHDPNGWNELIQIVLQGVLLGAQGCTQPKPAPRRTEPRGDAKAATKRASHERSVDQPPGRGKGSTPARQRAPRASRPG